MMLVRSQCFCHLKENVLPVLSQQPRVFREVALEVHIRGLFITMLPPELGQDKVDDQSPLYSRNQPFLQTLSLLLSVPDTFPDGEHAVIPSSKLALFGDIVMC